MAYEHYNTGLLYTVDHNYTEAVYAYHKFTRKIFRLLVLHSNNAQVFEAFLNIAVVDIRQSKYNDALNVIYKCLDIQLNIAGEENLNVATIYSSIGFIYDCQCKLELALHYLQKSLKIRL